MKKGLVFILIFLILIFSIRSDTFSLKTSYRKPVLIEFFTGTWCVYCRHGIEAIRDSLKYYPEGSIVLISYQIKDEFTIDGNSERATYYNLEGVPTSIFNGGKSIVGGSYGMFPEFKKILDQLTGGTSPVEILIEPDLETPKVSIKIKSDEDFPQNLRLFAILYENPTYAPQRASSDPYHYYVARKFLTPQEGKEIFIKKDQMITEEFKFEIDPLYKKENLGVVVFIQNVDTKEIIQSAFKDFTYKKILSFEFYSKASFSYVDQQKSVDLIVKNGKSLKSFKAQLSFDNQAAQILSVEAHPNIKDSPVKIVLNQEKGSISVEADTLDLPSLILTPVVTIKFKTKAPLATENEPLIKYDNIEAYKDTEKLNFDFVNFYIEIFALIGDLNRDFKVNGEDLIIFAKSFGANKGDLNYNPPCDFNLDNRVDGQDLIIFAQNFGK